jgi:hypothetical protein
MKRNAGREGASEMQDELNVKEVLRVLTEY